MQAQNGLVPTRADLKVTYIRNLPVKETWGHFVCPPQPRQARRRLVAMAQTMLAVVVPDGVTPGGVFHIQTPSGQTMAVTCPQDATAGSQIQVVVAAPTAAGVADPAWALSTLGTSIEGFVFDSPGMADIARGDGKTSSMFGAQASFTYSRPHKGSWTCREI